MKYLGILFACSTAFITLVALDFIEAQVERSASFGDFLADLKNTAESWVDYVTKIQALFCPDQPVCGYHGPLDRKDVLGTIPAALILGNATVKLEDVHNFVGICCLPCSCSDSCWQNGNCCPSKQLVSSDNETDLVKKECITATVRSYENKKWVSFDYTEHMYLMTTECFQDGPNLTLLENCQTPNTANFGDIIPVTSQTTGTTYWNRACAACNDDADEVIEWTPSVILKHIIPFFDISYSDTLFPDTFEKIFTFVSSPRLGDLIYIPPLSMEDSYCLRKDAIPTGYCETSLQWRNPPTFDWTSDSCNKFYNPVYSTSRSKIYPYMNIFCFICRNTIELTNTDKSCRKNDVKGNAGYLSALLNFKREEEKSVSEDDFIVKEGRCDCGEIFDPYVHICRPSYCPAGEVMAGCHCIQLLKNLSGMPVLLKVKITSRSIPSYPLTDAQIRKLHTSLKRTILAITQNTTASIGATFQQENDYLCIVSVRSDPGHDTKLTMEPFIKYLDTDDKLEVNVGKLAFSVTLTSKIALWKERNETTYATIYKAQDMEHPTSKFVQVYADNVNIFSWLSHQPLSRLLYCTHLQLYDTEYFERSGLIIVNVSVPMFSISDYYKVSPSQVRVCADEYLQASKGKNKRSGGHLRDISHGLMISSLAIVMVVTFTFNIN